MATIYQYFYFCFVLLSEMLRLTKMYSLYRDMYRIVMTPVSGYVLYSEIVGDAQL